MANTRWRRAFGLRALLAVLAVAAGLAAPSTAGAVVIASGPMSVDVHPDGSLQGSLGGSSLFYSGSSGLALYFPDAAIGERALTSYGYDGAAFTPMSQSAAVRDGDVTSQETVFLARAGAVDRARIVQTTRHRDGDRRIRVTYRIENLGTAALRFRAAVAAELAWGRGGPGVLGVAGEERFIGHVTFHGRENGLEQVSASRLPGDAAPVTVPAWSGHFAGSYYAALSLPTLEAGLGRAVDDWGEGVGAEWTDRLAEGLAPGASARYEVVWVFDRHAPLHLRTDRTERYVGATSTTIATVGDADGDPAAGAQVRWRVAGANATEGEQVAVTGADGLAPLAYTGRESGTSTLTAYVDRDGDGARDAGEPLQTAAAVTWSPPPPRLTVYRSSTGQVGSHSYVDVYARDAIGEPLTGGAIRWTLAGANTTAQPGRADVSSDGSAYFSIVPRYAGDDDVTVWVDHDGDGVRDAGEPQESWTATWAPPPPPISISAWSYDDKPAGATLHLDVNVYDEFGVPRSDAAVRWSVTGVTQRPEELVRTSHGWASLSYTAPRSGEDTITAYADFDEDGVRDAGEPQASKLVRWTMAPPPPETFTTLDGTGLDVSVSSRGRLQATTAQQRRLCSYWDRCDGLVLRFTGGALDGKVFSGSDLPFYGESQAAPVRSGDTVSQVTTYLVRFDDVDYVRVHQTTSLTDGAARFRVGYRLENLTGEPLRVRAAVAGQLSAGDRIYGPLVRLDTPRFVGAMDRESGLSNGLQEVAGSPWAASAADDYGAVQDAVRTEAGLAELGRPSEGYYGAGAQWAARDLAAAGDTAFEVDWVLDKPLALSLTPLSAVAETRHAHEVTATLIDAEEQPRNGVVLRWTATGANPGEGEVTTAGLGQAVISRVGRTIGEDVLTVYADEDGDAVHDEGEPDRTVTVQWRTETAVDPPVIDPLTAPDGTSVQVTLIGSGDARFFGLTPSDASRFPRCADGSPQVNMRMHVNVNPGAGVVVAGSMEVRTVSRTAPDLENPIDAIPPLGEAVDDTYTFVVECLRETAMYICYELEEAGLPIEEFCVLLGGIGLWDPSGVVYDKAAYDAQVAAGADPEQARAATAIGGAEVQLQRLHDGAYRRVLSGDPFVSPNVNPYVTEADGKFGWAVSPGTYRVVVTADGFAAATSRSVTVPPPDLELHVGLVREGAPQPAPSPSPSPSPTASPTPQPAPSPSPSPSPAPSPSPTASPSPSPQPTPVVTPSPTPEPTAEPETEAVTDTSAGYVPPPPPSAPSIPPSAAPPAPAPRQTAPPGARARIAGSQLTRRGRLRIVLQCPRGASECTGTYRLVALRGGRALGSLRYAVAPGRRARHELRLSRRAQKALRASAGRVRVLSVADAARTIKVRGASR